jgi:hypothetical protein
MTYFLVRVFIGSCRTLVLAMTTMKKKMMIMMKVMIMMMTVV